MRVNTEVSRVLLNFFHLTLINKNFIKNLMMKNVVHGIYDNEDYESLNLSYMKNVVHDYYENLI